MRIVLATQEDPFYIPQLISSVVEERRDDVVGIVILPGELTYRNVLRYVQWMGPAEFARHSVRYLDHRVRDLAFPRGRGDRLYSVAGVARRYVIPVLAPPNINGPDAIAGLRSLDPELVISIAAPQIFKEDVLSLPRHGCINLHNALLPKYQGRLPSFWVLANGEQYTGTTVHFMNEQVDSGDIILQERFPIEDDDTLHSLVYRTKVVHGPRLLLQAISMIESGATPTVPVDWSRATYFSFPDKAAGRRFRERGRRFR